MSKNLNVSLSQSNDINHLTRTRFMPVIKLSKSCNTSTSALSFVAISLGGPIFLRYTRKIQRGLICSKGLRNGPDKNDSNNGNEHVGIQLECKKVITFLLSVLTSDWLKQKKLTKIHKQYYMHPYFPTIFHITKSGLSLNTTEIVCGEHVKL